MQRLGKNIGAYLGETIDIGTVLRECVDLARANGWAVEGIPVTADMSLCALRLHSRKGGPVARVYISAGIHGDEPAGPLCVQRLLLENRWPEQTEIWLCPCLNPAGFPLNSRVNPGGVDLNRDYLHLKSAEIRAHIAWMDQQPQFDLALCLHEDWESEGFYVYELNPEDRSSLAETMVQRVSAVCPIDLSSIIEGRPAQNGIIRPSVDLDSRPEWPEAFYLLQNKTRLCYTLEAPSDFPLKTRVDSLVEAVQAALESV